MTTAKEGTGEPCEGSPSTEALRRAPAARRRLVRRLLAAPFERPSLVSLSTDHLILRAPVPRPPRRRLFVKLTVLRWRARTVAHLRWVARDVILAAHGPGASAAMSARA